MTGESEVVSKDDPYAETPIPRGPLEQERADDWEQYAPAVSLHTQKLIKNGGPDPSKWPKQALTDGSLVVIGSGIKCVGQFTIDALGHLKNADQVFYHVADPVTENYILKIKPNAKDMAVLYGNKKERYQTYIQMAEAMLYPVRLGQKVVTIYYGHPGIFVYASHRAIRIAHKQGFQAKMLPSVSALDCLFADLGVDPSSPGLQVLEATDFVVRKRRVLTDGHVIILQVGCIGDKGYRRQGYLMEHFHVLIEHLQSIYGADYKITHYVASQYPSVRPIIENIPLTSFLNADFAKKTITGVSTFYITPKDTRETDPEMAKKLGLQWTVLAQSQGEKSQLFSRPKKTKRNIAIYGPREQMSLKMLSNWSVPGAYDFTTATDAAKFMISLAQDPKKLDKFTEDPAKVLQNEPGILQLHKQYLASGNRSMVRVAVKPGSSKAAEAAAIELFTNGSFSKEYADEFRKYAHDPNADEALTAFLQLHGFNTTPDAVFEALQELRQTSLLPWRQIYHTKCGKLVIECDQRAIDKGEVIWNDVPIQGFTFNSGTLSWKADGVNQSNAVLEFTTQDNLPICHGKFWKKGESEPSMENYIGTIENFLSPLSVWRGKYRTVELVQGSTTKVVPSSELSVHFSSSNPEGIVKMGEEPVTNFKFSNKKLSWENGEITFFSSKATVSYPSIEKFYGYLWSTGQPKPSRVNFWGSKDATFLKPWTGKYKTYIGPDGKGKPADELIVNGGVTVAQSTVQFGNIAVTKFQFNNPVLSWKAEKQDEQNVEIRFEVFQNGTLGFKGMIWKGNESKPTETNFEGVVDSIYMAAWSACYYTKVQESGNRVVKGQPFSITKEADGHNYRITYKGEEISQWSYSGGKRQLVWSSSHNSTSGTLQFYIPSPENGTGLRFFGKIWPKDAQAPGKTNTWGSTVPFPGETGNSIQQLEKLLENLGIIALIELLKYAWKKFKNWLKSKMSGEPKEQQEELKKEYEDADEKIDQQEKNVNDQNAKTDELDPEADPSPEPPTPPDPAPEPPTNEVVDTDTDTTDTDTDVDTDVDVDVDVEIVVDICSLM